MSVWVCKRVWEEKGRGHCIAFISTFGGLPSLGSHSHNNPSGING